MRDNRVAGQRYVVPARGGQVGHRHDQRPRVLARDRQLAPDHVRCRGRPARAVDPQHDGADRSVGARLADEFHQRVGAGDGAVDRVETAASGVDHAHHVDDGHLRAPRDAGRAPRDLGVVFFLDELGAAQVVVDVVELVLVGHFVDQAQAQRVHRQERPLVNQRAHLVLGLLARVGNAAHQLFVLAAIERVSHLAMGGRERLLHVGVDGALVVADVEEVGERADPVEGAAQEQLVAGNAGQVEGRRRQQVDPIGGRREVVLAVTAVLEPRMHVLAAGAEVVEGIAHFLDLGPERRAEAAGPEQDAGDAGIGLGLANQFHVATHGQLARAEHDVGQHFGQVAARTQHERGARRHGRLGSDREIEHDHGRGRHQGRHDQEHDDEPYSAFHIFKYSRACGARTAPASEPRPWHPGRNLAPGVARSRPSIGSKE